MTERSRSGWDSSFPDFCSASPAAVRAKLNAFVPDASPEQDRAWSDSIVPLQHEVDEVLLRNSLAAAYSTILEYELPMERRRPDAVLLVGGSVIVIELKGKTKATQADIDQAAAYARDLRCYHRDCADRPVVPVLVPTRARGYVERRSGVHIAGPDALDALVEQVTSLQLPPIDRREFLHEDAYRPLPTLVQAARELFEGREIRTIWRAREATDPCVNAVARIVHEAAATRTRHLILVTGLPGSGKTLVGLRAVHARYLDDLSVDRGRGKPTTPAVFLSGNGPLVEVLQYELRQAGGGGKTFVRGVKDYVERYSAGRSLVPPEHVLVFDEAQRAFDADTVRDKHKGEPGSGVHRSEPEHFVEFAQRIPEWSVVIGLIGTGQEIHVGEEGGLVQWRQAVEQACDAEWITHVPEDVAGIFTGSVTPVVVDRALNLDTELRFHQADDLHSFVAALLSASSQPELAERGRRLEESGYHLRLTRSLEVARGYLRDRYREDPDKRFGLIASSKDKTLERFGVPNDFQSTKRVRMGPWYGDSEDSERSCRRLTTCVTEFGAQGLELDAALLAWGTDFVLNNGRWSNAMARGYRKGARVRDAFQLRLNAYRVLLTRARDGCVVFAPPTAELDETFDFLAGAGFRVL